MVSRRWGAAAAAVCCRPYLPDICPTGTMYRLGMSQEGGRHGDSPRRPGGTGASGVQDPRRAVPDGDPGRLGPRPFAAKAVLGVVKDVYFSFLETEATKPTPGKVTLVAVAADEPAELAHDDDALGVEPVELGGGHPWDAVGPGQQHRAPEHRRGRDRGVPLRLGLPGDEVDDRGVRLPGERRPRRRDRGRVEVAAVEPPLRGACRGHVDRARGLRRRRRARRRCGRDRRRTRTSCPRRSGCRGPRG